MNTLLGFDFSICKPTACILKNNSYNFVSWPLGLSKNVIEVYKNSPVRIVDRNVFEKKSKNLTEKMRNEIEQSIYLSDLILDTLREYLNEDSFIAFEGLSYASGGNSGLQLSGYKYMLMKALLNIVPLKNMWTFAPIQIKQVAGCSKKGMGKPEMIEAFKVMPTEFGSYLRNNETLFKTKKGNWITHLDDFCDAFWIIEMLQKELTK